MDIRDWKRPLKFVRSILFIGKTRLLGFEAPGQPGLDDEAKAAFFDLLGSSQSYLEFGSGGTTIAAAKAGVPTLSVEADRRFAEAVRAALPSNSSVQIIDVNLGITREWSTPLFVRRTPSRLAHWRRYFEAPFELIEASHKFPDFVLIDGRFRCACALKVAAEARNRDAKVQILFDDYFLKGREHYHHVEQWLGAPKRVGRAAIFGTGSSAVIPQSAIVAAAADYR